MVDNRTAVSLISFSESFDCPQGGDFYRPLTDVLSSKRHSILQQHFKFSSHNTGDLEEAFSVYVF